MTWSTRQHSKGRIDRAGDALISLGKDDPGREAEIAVIDNWRACHAYPLQAIKMTLLQRAKKVDGSALVAQRLKRRPSIELKLRDNPSMKLSQMQDIGGCRAVLPTVRKVRQLINIYKKSQAKNPNTRCYCDGFDGFDYIVKPKADGYRSVHLLSIE